MAEIIEKPKAIETRIFDIAKPGKFAPAHATSRPVIAAKQTLVRDPMMTAEKDSKPAKNQELGESIAVHSVKSKPLRPKPEESAISPDSIHVKIDTPIKTHAKRTGETGGAFSDIRKGAAMRAPLYDRQQHSDVDRKGEKQFDLEALIAKKEYVLPITSGNDWNSRLLLIGGPLLIIVLALVLLDSMLDAGFIHLNGVQPVTHFFTNP